MKKRYIVINAKEVVGLGFRELRERIKAGKFEVENDIAAFIYYPCLAVVEEQLTYADVAPAFYYRGYPDWMGMLYICEERLLRYFEIVRETEEEYELKFKI